jgi:transposase
VYGEDAIDVSSVRRWVRRFKIGENDSGDRPRSGRPHTAATTETKDAVDVPIRDGRRIATSELCAAVGIGKPAVLTIFRELGYRKFCARCVPSNTEQPEKKCA